MNYVLSTRQVPTGEWPQHVDAERESLITHNNIRKGWVCSTCIRCRWICKYNTGANFDLEKHIPGSGDASGIDSVPPSRACPNEELERTPPSLCLPASPMSTKINLREEILAIVHIIQCICLYQLYTCSVHRKWPTKRWSESPCN